MMSLRILDLHRLSVSWATVDARPLHELCKCLPVDSLIDWKVLVRVGRRRVVSGPACIGRIESIFVCMLFFIVVICPQQMLSLLLVTGTSISNGP